MKVTVFNYSCFKPELILSYVVTALDPALSGRQYYADNVSTTRSRNKYSIRVDVHGGLEERTWSRDRFIIDIHNSIDYKLALACVFKVIAGGRISEGNRSYCPITVFSNHVVYSIRNRSSDKFVVVPDAKDPYIDGITHVHKSTLAADILEHWVENLATGMKFTAVYAKTSVLRNSIALKSVRRILLRLINSGHLVREPLAESRRMLYVRTEKPKREYAYDPEYI